LNEPPIIVAFELEGIVAPICFKVTLNSDFFIGYLERMLASEMKPGETLFLDNLSVRKVTDILESLTEKGVHVIFIPEYSPDLSPIELAWSKIKSILRKLKARTLDKLYNALKIALESLTPDDGLHWFKHCGYSL
jgi:transposase